MSESAQSTQEQLEDVNQEAAEAAEQSNKWTRQDFLEGDDNLNDIIDLVIKHQEKLESYGINRDFVVATMTRGFLDTLETLQLRVTIEQSVSSILGIDFKL